MLKNLSLIFTLSILLIACTNNNEPKVYTSYSGNWKCEETSSIIGYSKPYMVIIERSSTDTTHYFIRNFFDTGDNQMIVVRIEANEIELLQQPTSGQVLQSFSGNSTPFTQLKLFYTVYDGERDIFFEAVYSRK